MRRGVEPHLQTGSGKNGRKHIGNRAFAVCPGDVDGTESLVRITEQVIEIQHVLQSGLVCVTERRGLD